MTRDCDRGHAMLADGQAGEAGLRSRTDVDRRKAGHEGDLRWRFQEADGEVAALPSVHDALVKVLTEGFATNHDPRKCFTQAQLASVARARYVDDVLALLPRTPPMVRVLRASYGEDRTPLYTSLVLPYIGGVAVLTGALAVHYRAAKGPERMRTRAEHLNRICECVAQRKATPDMEELVLAVRMEAEALRDRALALYVAKAEALGRRQRRAAERQVPEKGAEYVDGED